MDRFTDQVVFVTGGSSGIGAEACQLFVNEGAQVFVADLEEKNIIQRLGAEHAHYFHCDVAKQEDCDAAVRACIEKYGRLDVLFSNAGILHPYNTVPDQPVDVFHRVMQTNLDSLFYLSKAAIPLMQKQGKGVIVVTASISGLAGDHRNSAYCVSKAGVVNLCRVMALDHARDNIRVNAVCPGYIKTPMSIGLQENPKMVEFGNQIIPMGRGGEAIEIARIVLFLASDDASYITGQAIVADGGLRARAAFPEFSHLL